MVGLYLNSDGSLDKTQRICWMSMLFFTCGHTASLLKTHQKHRIKRKLLTAEPLWSGPSLALRVHLSSHLCSITTLCFILFCLLAQAVSLFGMVGNLLFIVHYSVQMLPHLLNSWTPPQLLMALTLGSHSALLCTPALTASLALLTWPCDCLFSYLSPKPESSLGAGWCSHISEPPISFTGLGIELVSTSCLMNQWVNGKKIIASANLSSSWGFPEVGETIFCSGKNLSLSGVRPSWVQFLAWPLWL